MKKTKKALASLAIAGMVLSMAPMSVFAADSATSNRIFGADRVQTAVEVAKQGWTTATTAIVAPAEDEHLVDALAAAPLAGAKNAPILLVEGKALTTATLDELKALGVKDVYVVGAVDAGVVTQLSTAGYNATAVKGASRTDTAAEVAKLLSAPKGSFVVGNEAIADALSVASYAAANNYQILIANPDGTLPGNEVVTGTSYVLGGPTLVKDVAGAKRVFGNDRYDTNKAILSELSYSYDKVYVANGEDSHLVDSLVASGLAGQTKSPIALTDNMAVKAAADLSAKMTATSQTIALGGPTVVADTVRDSVKYVAPGTLAVQSVSAINASQLKIVFNQAVNEDSANTVTNYSVSTTSSSLDLYAENGVGAELQDDNQTVILTLDAPITDKTTVMVQVKDVQQKDDSTKKVTLYVGTVVVDDQTAPDVVKVTSSTNSDYAGKAKIYFTEPVTSGTIKIDGSLKTVPAATMENGLTVEVTGLSLDASTSHTLQIINLTDGADNVTPVVTKSFSVTKDTQAPTVSLSADGDHKIKAVFSKDIDKATLEGAIEVADGTNDIFSSIDPIDDSKKEYTITLAPASTWYDSKSSHTVSVIFAGDVVADTLGNTMEETTKSVTLTEDNNGPVVTGITYKTDSDDKVISVKFAFNEGLAAQTATASDITVVDKDGVKVTGFFKADVDTEAGDKSVEFELADPDELSGTWSFSVPKAFVTDDALKVNDSVLYNGTVDFGAASAAKFELPDDAVTQEVGEVNILHVNFGAEVKGGTAAGSATQLSHYSLNGAALPEGTTITLDSSDKDAATITLPEKSVAKSDDAAVLVISGVQNASGTTNKVYTATVKITDNIAPTLQSASIFSYANVTAKAAVVDDPATVGVDETAAAVPATGKMTILVTFNEEMKAVTAQDVLTAAEFVVKNGSTELDLTKATVTSVAGKSKVYQLDLEFNGNYDKNKTLTLKTVNVDSPYVVDKAGNAQTDDITVTVTK